MTSRRTVAVAIDESYHSSLAFDFYVKNVRKPGDHLILIHVPEYDNVIKDSSLLTDPEIVAELLKDTEERSQELVNAYEIKMRELKIEGHVRQSCYGKPGESIIQAVKEERANILIIGTRGRGLIRRTFLGSEVKVKTDDLQPKKLSFKIACLPMATENDFGKEDLFETVHVI